MLIKSKPLNLNKFALFLICLLSLIYPSPSQAGFEWTPPPRIAVDAPVEQTAPAPESIGPLTPELSQEQAQDSNLPVPVGNVEQTPIQPPAVVESSPPTPQLAPVAKAPELSDFPVVEGFGKDIPLAIALRDIVPPHFAFAFNPREIAGTKVSWRGGKPWPEVLQSALSHHNLDGIVEGNNLVIYTKGIDATSVTADVAPLSSHLLADPVPLVEAMPEVTETPVIPVVDLKNRQKWSARPGSTLRETLESWSKSAQTEINWSTPYDYPVNNAFYFEGNFSDAVESLLSSYGGESPSPKGRLYPNLPDGPSVLMIN